VVGEELRRLVGWEERHRRLVARVVLALVASAVVDVVGAVLVWRFERHAHGTEIHGLGDAFFFVTVQLLTVSSQLKNPLTTAGRILDVALEAWAIFVVTGVAGAFAAFFGSADSSG
jgi:drug/metabolite transporter (DMT)-like permease